MHQHTWMNMESLQLFAQTAEAGDDPQGVTAAAALPQTTGVSPAPAAGVQSDADAARAETFEQLIRGPYKDLYDARVRDTVQKRLKGQKEIVEKYQALSPALELLAKKYAVATEDAQGLHRAIAQDLSGDASQEAPGEALPGDPQTLYDSWIRQAEETKARYPAFDLLEEVKNAQFLNLLKCDVDVTTAYQALHQEQMLRDAMAYTARVVESKLARSMANHAARPAENAVATQSAAVVKNDVSLFTRKDRADIIRRVQRGEIIRF